MEPRKVRGREATSAPRLQRGSRRTSKRRSSKIGVLFVFMIISLCLTSIIWSEHVLAPVGVSEQQPSVVKEPELPPLSLEEIAALEEERVRLQIEQELQEQLAFELSYYNESITASVLQSEWTIMPSVVAQGDVLLVRHQEERDIVFGDRTYTLQPFGAGYYAYLPVPVDMTPGEVVIGDHIVIVEKKQFETQHLEVSSDMESMRRDTERIRADQIKVNEARSQSESTFLFSSDSEFLKPIEGRLTTPFGYTRYVNGTLSGRHMAIDLAAPQGTPIMATNDGIVVLSDELYLAGNSIYIDHGMGLFSQYGHLFELHVETGDEVKQGDIIGLVGSTGFSTGPHLHFTFWAHNVPVNPDLFFGKTPFHWHQGSE